MLSDQVVEKLAAYVDDLNPEIEAETAFEFSAEFDHAEIADVDAIVYGQPAVIESDGDTVKLSLTVELPVTVRASFSFYVHDSVDDDYLGMGGGRGGMRGRSHRPSP